MTLRLTATASVTQGKYNGDLRKPNTAAELHPSFFKCDNQLEKFEMLILKLVTHF